MLIFITFYILINLTIESYIQYNFKTELNKEYIDNYVNSIINNNEYIEIEIGKSKQKIPFNIRFNEFPFYIMGSESKSYYIYNEKQSLSYKNLSNNYTKFNNYDYNCYGIYSSETFYFNNTGKNSIKEKENFPFYLVKSNKNNLPGLIGLKLNSFFDEDYYSFIKQLKNHSIIQNYIFSIKYLNDTNGEFLIGNFPLIEKYNKENFNFALTEIDGNANLWELKFDKISFGNEIIPENRLLNFVIELGVIKAPYIFLDIFEKKYVDRKTCFKILLRQKYNTFYCNKNFSLENFPSLFFYNKELNYTFELNYNDLFVEKDNLYHLLMIFEYQSQYHWKMGKPFLKKYQFIYDFDRRAIGYLVNTEIKSKFNISILIIFILLGLIFILIFIIFKYFKNKRKKRLNEIEENFLYIPQN